MSELVPFLDIDTLLDSLEEAAVLLTEVHVRFGGVKTLDDECEKEGEFTYGHFGSMYLDEVMRAREIIRRTFRQQSS